MGRKRSGRKIINNFLVGGHNKRFPIRQGSSDQDDKARRNLIHFNLRSRFRFTKGCPVTVFRWAVVVVQFLEWLLSTPEVSGSNPVFSKIYIEHCVLSTVLKKDNKEKKRPRMAHLKTTIFLLKKISLFLQRLS